MYTDVNCPNYSRLCAGKNCELCIANQILSALALQEGELTKEEIQSEHTNYYKSEFKDGWYVRLAKSQHAKTSAILSAKYEAEVAELKKQIEGLKK
jgi:hypothetical protein